MRFGLIHRIMTDALAALGVIALVASGQFGKTVSALLLVGLVLALAVRESWQAQWQAHPRLRHADTVAIVGIVSVQIARLLLGAPYIETIVEFAAALQIIRLATRRGAAHDQQIIVLALIHLIAGTVLGGGLGYGLCFVGVLVVAPGALVLSHLRREVEGNYRQGARDRTGLPVDVPRILRSRRVVGRSFLLVTCMLALPIFVFTAALFVIFPRVGLSLLLIHRQQTGRYIGFTNRVELGEVGTLRSDPTIAMRIEMPEGREPPPPRLTLHLRGTALDAYDGRTWTQSQQGQVAVSSLDGYVPVDGISHPRARRMRVDLQPIDPPVLFLPPGAVGLNFPQRPREPSGPGAVPVLRGPEGELRYGGDRGVVYDVFLGRGQRIGDGKPLDGERERYLALPASVTPRIAELAQSWTRQGRSPREKARAIEQRLRSEYGYDLGSPSGREANPLEHFLFESRRGHCEYYSTAMAVMLRSLGIPSRNVTGFIGGTYNRFGRYYAVRQGDAHSWVEAYLDGEGWFPFDPTPPADAAPRPVEGFVGLLRELLEATSQKWDRHVVQYDIDQQRGLLRKVNERYRRYRRTPEGTPMPMSRRIAAGVVIVSLALAAGGYLLYRRRLAAAARGAPGAESQAPAARLATALYEALDAAMASRGLPRSPGTPPLRHAELLASRRHPIAAEVLALTEIYVGARFGGAPLDDEARRDFERRVKALRRVENAPVPDAA